MPWEHKAILPIFLMRFPWYSDIFVRDVVHSYYNSECYIWKKKTSFFWFSSKLLNKKKKLHGKYSIASQKYLKMKKFFYKSNFSHTLFSHLILHTFVEQYHIDTISNFINRLSLWDGFMTMFNGKKNVIMCAKKKWMRNIRVLGQVTNINDVLMLGLSELIGNVTSRWFIHLLL